MLTTYVTHWHVKSSAGSAMRQSWRLQRFVSQGSVKYGWVGNTSEDGRELGAFAGKVDVAHLRNEDTERVQIIVLLWRIYGKIHSALSVSAGPTRFSLFCPRLLVSGSTFYDSIQGHNVVVLGGPRILSFEDGGGQPTPGPNTRLSRNSAKRQYLKSTTDFALTPSWIILGK